jgi:hypothetical protein
MAERWLRVRFVCCFQPELEAIAWRSERRRVSRAEPDWSRDETGLLIKSQTLYLMQNYQSGYSFSFLYILQRLSV